jgi:pimeloyl-ACP methyl ester carboxylesterase
MSRWRCFAAIGLLSFAMVLGLGSRPGMAQSRAHVYLFRGLGDIFSLGMDTLADELNKRGVDATSHSHNDWKSIADKAAADYKAGKEGPIILIGHSLGADAVMEMADYLGDKSVPVALVVPFDATQSFPASANVARVLNLTQRDYAYMRPGSGFRGSLLNVDLSSDPNIDHLNIDKSPRLHAQVIGEVLAIVDGHRMVPPVAAKPASIGAAAASAADADTMATPVGGGSGNAERSPPASATPAKLGNAGAVKSTEAIKPMADNGTPVIAQPKGRETPVNSAAPVAPPLPPKPDVAPQTVNPAEIPD